MSQITTIRFSDECIKKIEDIKKMYENLGIKQTTSATIKTCINLIWSDMYEEKPTNPWKKPNKKTNFRTKNLKNEKNLEQ